MMPKRILIQLDCDAQPSTFDAIVAVDASTVATKGTLTVRFKGFQREVIARLNALLAEADAVGDGKKAALREQLEKLRVVQDRLENGKEVTVRFVEGGRTPSCCRCTSCSPRGLPPLPPTAWRWCPCAGRTWR